MEEKVAYERNDDLIEILFKFLRYLTDLGHLARGKSFYLCDSTLRQHTYDQVDVTGSYIRSTIIQWIKSKLLNQFHSHFSLYSSTNHPRQVIKT